jgi:preprotein translocase subunit SecD
VPGIPFDFLSNRRTVRVIPESGGRRKQKVFEFTEHDYFYIVILIGRQNQAVIEVTLGCEVARQPACRHARSSVVQGDEPSRYGVGREFNAAGAQKMRQATVSRVGRPVAILIDGDVVTAPVLRAPISTSAVISGDYTQAEAERIVNGMGIR